MAGGFLRAIPGPRVLTLVLVAGLPAAAQIKSCNRVIEADVVAINQPLVLNRLGAAIPGGMIFVLKQDTVDTGSTNTPPFAGCTACQPGKVNLRAGKRPRPIVLRANVGDCLNVNFTNLLDNPADLLPGQTHTRDAAFHVAGLELRESILSDGSFVGGNATSLAPPVPPGNTVTYHYYAPAEGAFMAYSMDDGDPGQQVSGLFGAVNVQPEGAEWYRSQVTAQDLALATYPSNQLPEGAALKPGNTAAESILTGSSAGTAVRVVVKNGHLYTPDGHPIVNYQATYPDAPGVPILNMLGGGVTPCPAPKGCFKIAHSDLTAVITGPGAQRFPYSNTSPSFRENPASPDRRQPYREFTIIYHNSSTVKQAFSDQYESGDLQDALAAVGDQFGINYGMGGIGSEILANRIGNANQKACIECKFEEFFLSSWTVGDPAMPVNRVPNPGGGEAVTSPFPDDPSNVYHSYLRDHVRFRIMNASANGAHVHHQHAHQWLHTADSDNSQYLDSQMILQGTTFTLEMVYGGSGNRNLTMGDSIFHCHFYPHFAAGMWSLWRVHDVFEDGSRMLPDPEAAKGTPIPAVVPLPTLGMAPIPAEVALMDGGTRACVVVNGTPCDYSDPSKIRNPGFPFFVPGIAGHRAPHPPMDFAWEETPDGQPRLGPDGLKTPLDGGLPRHLVTGGHDIVTTTRLNFSKDYDQLIAFQLPEDGTPVEKAAMQMSSTRTIPTFQPSGLAGAFTMNGVKGQPGAPLAPPDVDDFGNALSNVRRYQAAVVQKDVVFNKKGWHYPQQRFITLWGDVADTMSGKRAPQPFFFRANTSETVEFWHTNLVPDYYQLDDFQVRTPTDIIGQHIHLVKFDVLASDGAANGFNYEDGTLSPDDVRARIQAINSQNGLFGFNPLNGQRDPNKQTLLTAKPPNPVFGPAPAGQNWTGAQTTIQRWAVDPLLNNMGLDRTLRTVFTHDHFGPSTHQQAGLYGGLLAEPQDSSWQDPSTGQPLYQPGGRNVTVGAQTFKVVDGGPTNWEAIIQAGPNGVDSYREFALEFQDYQLAYTQGSISQSNPDPNKGWADPNHAIGPPSPNNVVVPPAPYPTVISTGPSQQGYSVNYRSEPAPYRVQTAANPATCPASDVPQQTDLSYLFKSICRSDPDLNRQPGPSLFPPGPTSPKDTDPFTPLLRAYQGDRVQVRTLVGAHFIPHSFQIQGVNWLTEPLSGNSGFRNTQGMGISEHFEMLFKLPKSKSTQTTPFSDYLYAANSSTFGLTNGVWGLLRAFDGSQGIPAGLKTLPNNPGGSAPADNGACPKDAPAKFFVVAAIPKPIVFNSRTGVKNSTGLAYSLQDDVQMPGTEPAILRANAGDCVHITLQNKFTTSGPTQSSVEASSPFNVGGSQLFTVDASLLPASGTATVTAPLVSAFQTAGYPLAATSQISAAGGNPATWTIQPQAGACTATSGLGLCYGLTSVTDTNVGVVDSQSFGSLEFSYNVSQRAGLHPQLLSYDVTQSNGVNAGFNPDQTVGPTAANGAPPCPTKNGAVVPQPCINLTWYAGNREVAKDGTVSYVPVEFGAVNLTATDGLVQHQTGLVGALVIEPPGATVKLDANTRASATVTNKDGSKFREFVLIVQDDAQADGGNSTPALNYRTEPVAPATDTADVSAAFSDTSIVQPPASFSPFPQTPVFAAERQTPVRFRLLYPGGLKGQGSVNVFEVHGHQWQEHPYAHNSTSLGDNPLSEVLGLQQIVPNEKLDLLLASAGGSAGVLGDYKFGSFQNDFSGLWGIMRVTDAGKDALVIQSAITNVSGLPGIQVAGVNTVVPSTGQYAGTVQILVGGKVVGTTPVRKDGTWVARITNPGSPLKEIKARSVLAPGKFGGEYTATFPYPSNPGAIPAKPKTVLTTMSLIAKPPPRRAGVRTSAKKPVKNTQ